jgi:hypothetical protein
MATYLPGVTDYIPHIQPFRPDFNFYQKALETKEAQYKTGYDKISNLYGMLLNSDMTREPDLKKREDFFKNVQNEIQRMSTVDLSLEQNVNAAYRVFQPIIDDKNITHDIVYTKQYHTQKQRGQTLKNCIGKDCGDAKWWQEGDLEMDYKRQEYAESNDQSALTMQAPTFTPATDVQAKLDAAAKGYGIEVQSVTHTKDGYNITTTGGQQLVGPLKNYFTSIIKNDPLAQGMYRTKAYVDRKNFSYENAQKYGSKEAAEKVYLQDKIQIINEALKHPKEQTQLALDLLSSQLKFAETKLKTEGIPVSQVKEAKSAWDNLMAQVEVNQTAKDHLEETTAGIQPKELLGLDIPTMIARVDAAVAGATMTFDVTGYAQNYADLHRKVAKEADPYDKMAREHLYNKEMQELKDLHEKENIAFKFNLESGQTSESTKWEPITPGVGNTAKVSLQAINKEEAQSYSAQTRDAGLNLVNSTYAKLRSFYENGTPTEKEAARLSLISTFGGKDGKSGYLDENYKLKYADFKQNPGIHDRNSYDNWENLYKRALENNKSNSIKGVGLYGDTQVAELSDLESQFNFKKKVRDAVMDTYIADRNKVYDYIKINGKTKHADASDIAKASSSLPEFIQGYTKAYGESYKQTNRDIVADATEAYGEIQREYNEIYAENPHNMLSSTRPSISSGGGVISSGNKALFDASRKGPENEAYMQSIKQDVENPNVVVQAGSNVAVASGETPVLKQSSNDDLKKVVNYYIDQYTNRNWKKGEPGFDDRPIANITYHGVAGNDANTVAIEFDFNQGWADKAKGTSKMAGPTAALYGEGGYNGKVTVYVNKSEAKNLMKARSGANDLEMLVSNGGKLVIDNYKDFGGVATITKDDKGLKVSGTINYIDDKGDVKTTPLEERRANTSNIDEFRKTVLKIMAIPNKANIAARWNIYNAQKKAFSVEEIQQMLQNAGQ